MDALLDGSWLASIGMEKYQSNLVALDNFVRTNILTVGLFIVFTFLTIRTFVARTKDAKEKGSNKPYLDAPDFPEITGLEGFDWKLEDPLKLRVFKPKYYLTMGECTCMRWLAIVPFHG